jgi:hypothetical protein
VRLPFDDLLLPWALEHDPEAAEIILAVQAKAATWEPPEPRPLPSQPEPATTLPQRVKRSNRPCAVCDRTFLAKRADARYCSPKCRMRAARHPGARSAAVEGHQRVTDKLPASLQ